MLFKSASFCNENIQNISHRNVIISEHCQSIQSRASMLDPAHLCLTPLTPVGKSLEWNQLDTSFKCTFFTDFLSWRQKCEKRLNILQSVAPVPWDKTIIEHDYVENRRKQVIPINLEVVFFRPLQVWLIKAAWYFLWGWTFLRILPYANTVHPCSISSMNESLFTMNLRSPVTRLCKEFSSFGCSLEGIHS